MQTTPNYLSIYHNFILSHAPCVKNIPLRKDSFLGTIFSPLASLACHLGFYRSQSDLNKTLNAIFRTVILHSHEPEILDTLDTCISHLHHLKLQIKSQNHLTESIDRILHHLWSEHFSNSLTI